MTELQTRLLDLLSFFHRFCKENNLRYYAIGGTALGAMRHGGFIPWDDDIDVGMPRPDYEKLKQLSKTKVTGKYKFEFPGEAKDFVYPFGKMYDTTTTLVENTRYKTTRGIYLDIFPLDGVGNTYEEAVDCFHVFERKVHLILTTVCAWRKGRSLYKNIAMMAMRCVPSFILSTKKFMEDFEAECMKKNYDDCKYVAPCGAPDYHERVVAERKWYGTPVEGNFENIKIMMPEMPNKVLTGIYGDWRTPPPVEKQVTHHDYIKMDLNEPYLNE